MWLLEQTLLLYDEWESASPRSANGASSGVFCVRGEPVHRRDVASAIVTAILHLYIYIFLLQAVCAASNRRRQKAHLPSTCLARTDDNNEWPPERRTGAIHRLCFSQESEASVFACSQPEEGHDSNNQSKFICIAPFMHKRQPKEECCNLIRLTSNSTATFQSSINLHPIFSCCVEIRGGKNPHIKY